MVIPAPPVLPPGPELFIGLVGAVGTDLEAVTEAVEKALAHVNYAQAESPSTESISGSAKLGLSQSPYGSVGTRT